MRVAVFCEAVADFSIAAWLIDRVVREEGPDWVREHLDARPWSDLREWVGAGRDSLFFDIHHLHGEARARNILLPRNRFGGQRGGPGALMAYTAFLVAREEARLTSPIDAIVIVWDMDDQGDSRREGLAQGRASVLLPMVLGCPDMEREAWVLAGFDPENVSERERLEQVRKDLGFDPRREAHRLRDRDDHSSRSPKRVVASLTNEDRERESRCWTDPPLDTLRARGEHSGLRAYLDEVRERLVPLWGSKAAKLRPSAR